MSDPRLQIFIKSHVLIKMLIHNSMSCWNESLTKSQETWNLICALPLTFIKSQYLSSPFF